MSDSGSNLIKNERAPANGQGSRFDTHLVDGPYMPSSLGFHRDAVLQEDGLGGLHLRRHVVGNRTVVALEGLPGRRSVAGSDGVEEVLAELLLLIGDVEERLQLVRVRHGDPPTLDALVQGIGDVVAHRLVLEAIRDVLQLGEDHMDRAVLRQLGQVLRAGRRDGLHQAGRKAGLRVLQEVAHELVIEGLHLDATLLELFHQPLRAVDHQALVACALELVDRGRGEAHAEDQDVHTREPYTAYYCFLPHGKLGFLSDAGIGSGLG